MNEIDDRRQRAREAYADHPHEEGDVEDAIEVATQIKLTPEMVGAVHEEIPGALYGDVVDTIRRFCAVAGFEVIE